MAVDIPVRVILEAVDKASKEIGKAAKSFGELDKGQKIAAGAAVGLGAATGALTLSVIKQAGAFEQYQVALKTILGDADQAEAHFQKLKDFAKATPFNFEEIVKNNNLLLAMGSNVDDVIDEMSMLGNVAAGLSVPIERVALNFGQVRAQGKLTGRELRDFTTLGIPIMQELADVMGVAKEEIGDLVSEGSVGFDVVQKAFENMTGEGGKFFNLMEDQSKTTPGRVSNLEDSLQQMQATMGKALLPAVNKLLDAVLPLIDQFASWAEKNPKLVIALLGVGLALGAIGTAALILGPIIAGLGAIFAIVTSPITLIVVAIAAVIAGIVLLVRHIQKNQEAIKAWATNIRDNILTAIENAKLKFMEFIDFIASIPGRIAEFVESLKQSLINFLIEGVPYAIGFLVGRFERFISEDMPNFVNGVIAWVLSLREKVPALIEQLKTDAIATFMRLKDQAIETAINLANSVVDWFKTMGTNIQNTIKAFPGMVQEAFTQMKDNAVNTAKSLYEGVLGWIDKVKNLFQGIIDKAGEAISRAREAFNLGREAGAREFGGSVSAASPVLVGERGPELFVPQTAGRITPNNQLGGVAPGSPQIVLNVNVGTLIASPTERRAFAERLYKDLATVARSQNTSVADLFGA